MSCKNQYPIADTINAEMKSIITFGVACACAFVNYLPDFPMMPLDARALSFLVAYFKRDHTIPPAALRLTA